MEEDYTNDSVKSTEKKLHYIKLRRLIYTHAPQALWSLNTAWLTINSKGYNLCLLIQHDTSSFRVYFWKPWEKQNSLSNNDNYKDVIKVVYGFYGILVWLSGATFIQRIYIYKFVVHLMMLAEKIDCFSLLNTLRGTAQINWSAAFGTKKRLKRYGSGPCYPTNKFLQSSVLLVSIWKGKILYFMTSYISNVLVLTSWSFFLFNFFANLYIYIYIYICKSTYKDKRILLKVHYLSSKRYGVLLCLTNNTLVNCFSAILHCV